MLVFVLHRSVPLPRLLHPLLHPWLPAGCVVMGVLEWLGWGFLSPRGSRSPAPGLVVVVPPDWVAAAGYGHGLGPVWARSPLDAGAGSDVFGAVGRARVLEEHYARGGGVRVGMAMRPEASVGAAPLAVRGAVGVGGAQAGKEAPASWFGVRVGEADGTGAFVDAEVGAEGAGAAVCAGTGGTAGLFARAGTRDDNEDAEAVVGARRQDAWSSVGATYGPGSGHALGWAVVRAGLPGDAAGGATGTVGVQVRGATRGGGTFPRVDLAAMVAHGRDFSIAATARDVARDGFGARDVQVGYLQRLVVLRRIKNPFEAARVAGIHNYIDVAVEAGGGPEGALRVGVAWQVNKNVMVKGVVDSGAGAAVCLALRSWFQPIATLGVTLGWDPSQGAPTMGVTLALCSNANARGTRTALHRGLTGTEALPTSAVYDAEALGEPRVAQLAPPPDGLGPVPTGNPRRIVTAEVAPDELAGARRPRRDARALV